MKILILMVALFYSFSGLQTHINEHPTLLWCEDSWDEDVVGNLTLCTLGGDTIANLTKCFDPKVEGIQKLRVCNPDNPNESTFHISLLIACILSNSLSLVCSLWLNNISDYIALFKATRTLLWFIPTNPVVHRSALSSMVNSDKEEDLETLK